VQLDRERLNPGLEVEQEAKLEIPRFLPIGGIADGLAGGFMDAALASLAPAV